MPRDLIVPLPPRYGALLMEATNALYRALLRDGRRDQADDSLLWRDCYGGKAVELGAALALGVPPEVIAHDSPGAPDLVVAGREVDVKAVRPGARSVAIREGALRKDRLLIVGRYHRPSTAPARVALLGWTHTGIAALYPRQTPARGHRSAYVSLPLADLQPLEECP